MSNPVLAGKRIAVIEDEVPLGVVLGIMLNELGCVQAGVARTLAEALQLAEDVVADAVLLDYRLKDEHSDPAAVRFLERGIKVILTTGAETASLPETLKPCAVMHKPFGLANLEDSLVQALRA
jgi:DNA-binding NtrC family response regulator